MNRKILSITIIMCTIICVFIMIHSNKEDIKKNSVKEKVEVLNKSQNTNKKTVNEKIEEKNNNVNIGSSSKEIKKDTIVATDSYKKDKMDMIGMKMDDDKKEFSSEFNVKGEEKDVKNSQETVNKTNNNDKNNTPKLSEKNDVPVFKVSKYKIKDDLTLGDKQKLLSVASKLSAVDYEKINGYLKNGSDKDIKNTIGLLKQRLSDKDYEKVEEVAEKFINMESIN